MAFFGFQSQHLRCFSSLRVCFSAFPAVSRADVTLRSFIAVAHRLMRAMPDEDVAGPDPTRLRTGGQGPERARPLTKTSEPERTVLRVDKRLPRCKRSMAKGELSRRPRDLVESNGSKCTESGTDLGHRA